MRPESQNQLHRELIRLQALTCFFASLLFLYGYILSSEAVYLAPSIIFLVLSFILFAIAFDRQLLFVGVRLVTWLRPTIGIVSWGGFFTGWFGAFIELNGSGIVPNIVFFAGIIWFFILSLILSTYILYSCWRYGRTLHREYKGGWRQFGIGNLWSFLRRLHYENLSILPLQKKVTGIVIGLEALLLFGCFVALLFWFGPSPLWVWLVIFGIVCFELGAYYGWIGIGIYVRAASVERDPVKKKRYRYLASHNGMHAIVTLIVGICFFTLAGLMTNV